MNDVTYNSLFTNKPMNRQFFNWNISIYRFSWPVHGNVWIRSAGGKNIEIKERKGCKGEGWRRPRRRRFLRFSGLTGPVGPKVMDCPTGKRLTGFSVVWRLLTARLSPPHNNLCVALLLQIMFAGVTPVRCAAMIMKSALRAFLLCHQEYMT